MSYIEFSVNGQACSVNCSTHANTTLNAYLRYHLGLPGTKAMCHQGVCGSCIVNVTAKRQTSGAVEFFSVNSCLVLIFSCHGWDITTVESIGNRRDGYNEIQKRFSFYNGTQCGYCTPGWVMSLNSLLPKKLTKAELENSFASNTCRCTGYRGILDAIQTFGVDSNPAYVHDIEEITTCLKDKNKICDRRCSVSSDWSVVSDEKTVNDMIVLNCGQTIFIKVFDEDQIFQVLKAYGTDSYMLIDGNTGKAVIKNFAYATVLVDISDVTSLKQYYIDQNLVLGANISIQDCMDIFKTISLNSGDFSYLEEFYKHMDLVANIPVRKIGSLAGNLMLKHMIPSYQSDIFLLFEAVGAMINIRSSNGETTKLTLPNFLKYDMKGKLIVNLELPPQGSNYIFRSYKIMPRSQNALALVNAAFNIKMNMSTSVIEKASIVYGNISADFIHATQLENYLERKNVFNNQILQGAIQVLSKELFPKAEPPKPSPEMRKKLAIDLFYKFVLSICPSNIINPRYKSGGVSNVRPVSSGYHDFQADPSLFPLNQPLEKLEGVIQSSGEAQYVNDIPPHPNQVFAAFVLSKVHAGSVDVVDKEDILKLEGVSAVFTAKDIKGVNSFTYPGFQLQTEDEEILADQNIKYFGQPVAIVVACNEDLAVKAAELVQVTYKNVPDTPPVLTIDDAKKDSKRIFTGSTIEPKGRGNNVKKVVKGVYEIHAQYHYYLEPLTCVVVPVDKGLEVYDASQWMDLTQAAIARSLNIPESQVTVIVRRLGGGFGGKLSRGVQVACGAALVVSEMDVPCRFILPMTTNLTIAGRRLPCQCEYEAGVDDDGKIQYLNAVITEDDGFSHNENILSYTAEGFPNCYNKDYFNLKTFSVLTDKPSNTFARAPGTMEGIACIENIMEHIAVAVQKDPTDVRLANMRTEDNDLPSLIENLKMKADYDKRLDEVKKFNKSQRWYKRAIKINVMLFPVVFYGNYTAMVSIYRGDGTVTVTTGGIEMGQGVNTKAAQVCAYELGIPVASVSVLPSYSFVAANNVFSGSSIVSESVCYSIIRACSIIKERLQPIKDKLTNPTWFELIKKAGEEEIDLTASYMMNEKEPDLSGYSAFSVSILEVELNCLTGRFEIIRVDILEDAGLSANPKLDIGQVEGAYVQGASYFTYEDFKFSPQGELLNNDALSYEVYLAKDIPIDMRVYLRYNSKNPKGVLGAKAVGEMGICLSHGIQYALRDCIVESRKDSGYDPTEWIKIEIPMTTESILNALDVQTSEFLLS